MKNANGRSKVYLVANGDLRLSANQKCWAEQAKMEAALEKTLEDFPNAKAATRDQFIDNQISGLSSILNILYVLLALSVIVSLFGIINTLILSVV